MTRRRPRRDKCGRFIQRGRPTRDEDRRYVDRYVTWWICADCYRTTRRAWRTTP
jgi:hypothetical protein